MFAYPLFALTRQQLKRENNKLNIYTQYLMNSTFETIWLFFHRPVGLLELLILYTCVQFYMPRASDYRLISETADNSLILEYSRQWGSQNNVLYKKTYFRYSSLHLVGHTSVMTVNRCVECYSNIGSYSRYFPTHTLYIVKKWVTRPFTKDVDKKILL